jgi:cytochrome b561
MAYWHNTAQRFGSVAKIFHWVGALSLIGILVLGWFMEDLHQPWRKIGYVTHKTWGLWLMLWAVAWIVHKLWQTKVQPVPTQTKPLRRLSALVKTVLLLCAFAMPLSGWVFTSAWGSQFYPLLPFVWSDYFGLPNIVAKNHDLAKAIFGLHVLISWIIVGAVALHFLGAMYHHFIKRDIVLRRMLPNFLGGLTAAADKSGRKVVRLTKNKFRR